MSPTTENLPHLVGDIGGTHTVLARASADGAVVGPPVVLMTAEHATLADAIRAFLLRQPGPPLAAAALAVAGPVTDGSSYLMNRDWVIDAAALAAEFQLPRVSLLNDFSALAHALPGLAAGDLANLGGGAPIPKAPRALIGPGTGLGVSGLVPNGDSWIVIEGEGGHATIAPRDDREADVIAVLRRRFGHVSCERVLSGRGIANLYAAVAELAKAPAPLDEPGAITRAAIAEGDPVATEALGHFCAFLGGAAGNLALTIGARAGVYIGGGIAPRIIDFLRASKFRERFEDKGRLGAYLAPIPAWLITASHPALGGAALVARAA